jgi:hypothetical protein
MSEQRQPEGKPVTEPTPAPVAVVRFTLDAAEPITMLFIDATIEVMLVVKESIPLHANRIARDLWGVTGVYVLLGPPTESDALVRARPGMGGDVLERLRDHPSENPWFTRAVVARDTRQGWNSAEAGYLEGRLHDLCRASARVDHDARRDHGWDPPAARGGPAGSAVSSADCRGTPPRRCTVGSELVVSQYIVRYQGFARAPGVCHVVVAHDQAGEIAVLVGELRDNPGTSTVNAIEQVAGLISEKLLDGREDFSLYQYTLVRIPDPDRPRPTFQRVTWNGGRAFTMPTWEIVDPHHDPWLRYLTDKVKSSDYTLNSLLTELDRDLELIDGVAEPLPWAS